MEPMHWMSAAVQIEGIHALAYVTGYGKTDHSRQTLNLRNVSSKFNSQYANFNRVHFF